VVAFTAAAYATTTENQAALHKYFRAKGQIISETYRRSTGRRWGWRCWRQRPRRRARYRRRRSLWWPRVAGRGNPQEVLAEALPAAKGNPQYTLMMNGKHLMTYGTSAWTDSAGVARIRGDLRIRDLEAEGGIKTSTN